MKHQINHDKLRLTKTNFPISFNQKIIKCQLVFLLQFKNIQKDCNLCANAKTLNCRANFVSKNMFFYLPR